MIISENGLYWVRGNECHGAKIVLSHGCFDILTIAHIRHLIFARSRGMVLVVSVTGDEYVNKGDDRPFYNERHRAETLNALNAVDYIVISQNANALPIIKALKPDVFVKGMDTLHKPGNDFDKELQAVEAYGGMVTYSPNVYECHTTDVYNQTSQEKTE